MALDRLNLVWLILMTLVIGGCTQPLNERGTLGGSFQSPTLSPLPVIERQTVPTRLFDQPTKLHARWSTTRYISSMDGVVHGWAMTLWAPLKRTDPARVYGRFPSTSDVLMGSPNHPGIVWINDVLYTIDEFGRSFIGTPYAFGYLGLSGKLFEPVASPSRAWKRTDTLNTWSSGFPADQRTELDTEKQSLTEDTKHE